MKKTLLISVHEVDAHAHLQAGGVERVVRGGKVGVAAVDLLVEVGPGDKKSRLLHPEVGIQVHDHEVAALHLLLAVEGHRCRVIGRGVVLGVIIAVNAHLHVQHAGDGEGGVQVAVDGKLG